MSRTFARHDIRRRPAEERRAVRVARTLARIEAMESAASPMAGNR